MKFGRLLTLLGAACLHSTLTDHRVSAYDLVRDYSGASFFDRWAFYGSWDNLTDGDVNFLDHDDATSQRLAYTNDAGNAIIKVDNTSNVAFNNKRNSIRITSNDFYDLGSLWIIDANHIPYGCGTWPSIWSAALQTWPIGGEIDIIEAINLMSNNQMALHTTQGCTKTTPPNQTGRSGQGDCSQGSGCVVSETKPNSWGSGFAQAGGGVFAAQFDVAGIYMWFWSRPDVPASIKNSTSTSGIDISDWGSPSGAWPTSSCNITEFFTAQQLVIDITLCGVWAGVPASYNATCANHGSTGQCYADTVVGPGSPAMDNAYFELPFIRAYTTTAAAPSSTSTPTSTSGAATSSPTTSAGTPAGTSLSDNGSQTSAATHQWGGTYAWPVLAFTVVGVFFY
ncbi:glycoside hydrolase family 16 protein [Plicaturopsis crispa FD-325 SS-3]|nr:glycoside hydrolase family 16 protein [Plicaturopsis crispa FD-325 SS-3]